MPIVIDKLPGMLTRRQFVFTALILPPVLSRVSLFGQQPATPAKAPTWKPVFTPIRRNVGYFTASGGTIGYLINSAGVVVVDSQYPDSAKACLDGLNEQSKNRPVDVLLNTHHHSDHTGGNVVFKPVTKAIVAQARVPELQRIANAEAKTPVEQAYPTATFDGTWNKAIGDEVIHADYFGPAHTGGDSVIYFEKANVVHVGDLVWNRLQTFVDRTPGGASATNWITVTEKIAARYPADAVYLCGHAKAGLPVAISKAEVMMMRDYLTALVEYVRAAIKAGKTRDEISASKDVLKGFDDFGPLTTRALQGTYDELIGRRP